MPAGPAARPPELRVHRSLTKALRLFDADRLRWLDEASAMGPLVALGLGPVKMWVVTDADLARNVLVTEAAAWTRPPATLAPIRLGVGENLFTQSDTAWAALQPLVAPAFRKKALEPRLAAMDEVIADEVGALPLDTPIDLELATGRMALRLAAWVLLGEELDPVRAEALAHHQREVVRWIGVRLGQLTGFLPVAFGARAREMKEHRAALDAYADEVIARARTRTNSGDDVLSALLAARPAGRPLTPDEHRTHVLGLFLAGNETTGAALAWTLVHAAAHRAQWRDVREQPERRTSAFLSETLRLTPAVWGIPRTPVKAGVTLTSAGCTTRVRRGQLANIYLRGLHRDAAQWTEPLRFDPSRHETGPKESRALLPFGLGPRGCIGQHLAMAEMSAAVPALARRGDVVIDGPVVPDAGFALRVRGGLTGRFTKPATNADDN
jgi:cytochrome P450